MSNYRRLISYIYVYEGGVKGKNIGFAKIEIRNGQCKIHVNVKRIFLGSSDIGVYLLSPNQEILLGRIFIRNGAGEFRASVSAGDVEGSGCTMEQCYGLTIHETESTWRTYTTIWEDAVTQAAEVELANVTSDKVGAQSRQELRPSVSKEIQRELEKEEASQQEMVWSQERFTSGAVPSEPLASEKVPPEGTVAAGAVQSEKNVATEAVQSEKTMAAGAVQSEKNVAVGAAQSEKTVMSGVSHPEGNMATDTVSSEENAAIGITPPEKIMATGSVRSEGNMAAGSVPSEGNVVIGSVPPEGNVAAGSVPLEGIAAIGSVPSEGIVATGSVPPEGNIATGLVPPEGNMAAGSVPPEGIVAAGSVPPEGNMATGSVSPEGIMAAGSESPEEIMATGAVRPGEIMTPESVKPENNITAGVVQPIESGMTESTQPGGASVIELHPSGGFSVTGMRQPEALSQSEDIQKKEPSSSQSNQKEAFSDQEQTMQRQDHDKDGWIRGTPVEALWKNGSSSVENQVRPPESSMGTGNGNSRINQNNISDKVLKFAKVFMQGKNPETDGSAQQKEGPEASRPEKRMPYVMESEKKSLPEPGNPERLKEWDRQDQEENVRGSIWNQLQRRYAKVLAFDYDYECEILSIKPQDIGILPRENWVYGNNSFLLHGYYNYRHLILARLENPEGEPRYLLGVPGHYFSNEKNLASMFGFPHFVLARKQPEENGRFGYWYTDLRL